jgi:hypothetical protein
MRFMAALLLLPMLAWSQQSTQQPTVSKIYVDFGSRASKNYAFVSCTNGGTLHAVALDSTKAVIFPIPEAILPAQRLWISCNTPEEETVSQECMVKAAQEPEGRRADALRECIKTRLHKIIIPN